MPSGSKFIIYTPNLPQSKHFFQESICSLVIKEKKMEKKEKEKRETAMQGWPLTIYWFRTRCTLTHSPVSVPLSIALMPPSPPPAAAARVPPTTPITPRLVLVGVASFPAVPPAVGAASAAAAPLPPTQVVVRGRWGGLGVGGRLWGGV